jgi:hypothetical protein
MNNLFASALTAAAIAWSATIAQSMPVGGDQTQDSLVVLAADKCGIGRYRDANGVCRRKYQFGIPPKQYYGSCGGTNAHRVCNFSGQCWMVCD